ncbi:MAG: PIN domain nuclease [Deltaproteobacteria bacterium]|nr:PIN domain nuclease [Deltaproteobacteria bacterium]
MKILVDTSVWIDFFNGVSSAPQAALSKLLEEEEDVCISAYILTETLQGFNHDAEFKVAKRHLLHLQILGLSIPESYVSAARLYRVCRRQGVTIRKTADCLIAQTAIQYGMPLLHNDKDFNRIASVSSLRIYTT